VRVTRLHFAAALVAAFATSLAAPAFAAKTQVFYGVVTHVSVNNIKARSSSGQELSFLIVPRFNKLFKSDGKTTVQMKDIKPGRYVRIEFDQGALGARHADRILVDTHPLKPLNS
jgi:hypothetical protein